MNMPSTNPSHLFGQNVHGVQTEPCALTLPPMSEETFWNDFEVVSVHSNTSTPDPNQPRSWRTTKDSPRLPLGQKSRPSPERGHPPSPHFRIKPFQSHGRSLDIGTPQQIGDRRQSERQISTRNPFPWPSSGFATEYQRIKYPSPPEDANFATNFRSSQAVAENDTNPRYILQPVRPLTAPVPTINFHLAETHGDTDHFPIQCAENTANFGEDTYSLSPFARPRTPASSTNNFETLASPAFSSEGVPDTPITDETKPMFDSIQYWNSFDQSQTLMTNSSEWWNDPQIPISGPEETETGGIWPFNSGLDPLYSHHPSTMFVPDQYLFGTTRNGNNPAFSLLSDNSQTLAPPCTAQDFRRDGLSTPQDQQMFAGCSSAPTAQSCTYPDIDEVIGGATLNETERGSFQVNLIDTRRTSTQENRSRHMRISQQVEKAAMNNLLVKWKNEGMSYKDIKARGGFKDAESTLRGRYRTLTKPKEARVRKPEWLHRDFRLLREAVRKCSRSAETGLNAHEPGDHGLQANKISWKRVAQYIRTHGGSYLYGNATCKKKWNEIQANLSDGGNET